MENAGLASRAVVYNAWGVHDEVLLREKEILKDMAVVIQGVEPPGFRGMLRQHLFEVHSACGTLFREFNGDPIDSAHTLPLLQPLMEYADASAQSVPGR